MKVWLLIAVFTSSENYVTTYFRNTSASKSASAAVHMEKFHLKYQCHIAGNKFQEMMPKGKWSCVDLNQKIKAKL